MTKTQRLVLIHGLAGSSQGFKATFLRELFPSILTPDFRGGLEERMTQLNTLLSDETDWTLIGSSFGGLMAALYTIQHPDRVKKQILLAPALIWPDFANQPSARVAVPTIIYHGRNDELLPLDVIQRLAGIVFENLTFHAVDDDHGLHRTVSSVDWHSLLS